MSPTRSAAIVAVALTVLGCRAVTSERIQTWKKTAEGRERLVQALRDDGLAVERRAEAAAALAEEGWAERVESTIAGMPFEVRARVIPAIATLVGPDLASRDTRRAGEARETLFALRRQATTDEATRSIDSQLLPALERDLRAGRVDGAGHSLEEILIAIGPLSTRLAQHALSDPKAPIAVPVAVIDKLGDKAAREAGGAALVDRVQGGAPLTPALWQALGTLGGPRTIAFLQEKVEKGTGDEPDHAARTLAQVRRDPALLPFALRVARDGNARPVVREQMLAIAQSIGGEEARKGLVEMIATEPDPEFQFRVFAAALKCDGGKAIVPSLEAFPARAAYDPTAVREHLVTPMVQMGWQAREGLFKALESPSPLARMTAVWTLEKSGFESDAKPLGKLEKDRARPKGFPTALTIGAEATRVAAALRKPAG